MGYMLKGRELYAQDATLVDELGVDERTLRRYLEEIEDNYTDLIVCDKQNKIIGGRKVTVYRTIDSSKDSADILSFFINNDAQGMGWLIQLIHSNDPMILKGFDDEQKRALQRQVKKDRDVVLFRNNPLENLMDDETDKRLRVLKKAVKNHEYRTFHYTYNQHSEILEDLKCLKLIFMKNNWYLATENKEKEYRLLRIAFIDKIEYSKKNNYQKSVLDRYDDFFASMQNPMSLPFVEKKTAILKAHGRIAIYFRESMKKFMESQTFIREEEDGVIFSVEYTQSLEVLPFIKEWLPDMEILEPKELREQLREELQKYLN
ncbi:MAG: WYL domain-containing protein [Campylobacterales bacterium]|nr:WYL domain-containing protein [Campylobacterales bacterium]